MRKIELWTQHDKSILLIYYINGCFYKQEQKQDYDSAMQTAQVWTNNILVFT